MDMRNCHIRGMRYLLRPVRSLYQHVWLLMLVSVCCISITGSAFARVVKVGVSHMPPVSYVEDELPRGFIIDLMEAMAEKEDWQIEWVFDDWSNLLAQVQNGQIDILTSVGYSPERSVFMDFSKEHFTTVWGQVYANPENKIETVLDLDNKKIAVLKGDINGIRLKSLCQKFGVNCELVEIKQYNDIYEQLERGNIQAAASNNMVGQYFARQYGLEKTTVLFDPFKVLIAAPKGSNKDILAAYDARLMLWRKNKSSVYYQLRDRWFDGAEKEFFGPWLWYVLPGLFLVALITTMLAVFFKRQVNRRMDELVNRQQQLDQIINLVPHMIYVSDDDGRVIIANKTALNHFGYEVFPQAEDLSFLSHSSRNFALFEDDEFLIQPDALPIHKEVNVMDSQEQEKVFMLSRMPLIGRANKSPAILTVGVDITQSKEYEEQIEYLAKFDMLTGLANRVSMEEHITRALKYNKGTDKNGALLLIDLDDFKNINDAQGHAIGDSIIKEVAERLKGCVRAGDLVARIGGDEFVIHLAELTKDANYTAIQAEQIARVVHSLLKKPYEVAGFSYHLTASVGVVIYPQHGDSQQLLLQRADTAVYKAKENGKNRIYVFEPEFEAQVIKKHAIENALREAVDKEQLRLEYQPVVDAERQVVGAEALVRWERPGEGTISPADFIAVAETSGLIAEIGDWVIDNVCKQIREWLDQGKSNFFIAVNLSVNQIRDKNFYHKVEYLVQQYHIPQNYLEFEVTESILMYESTRSISILNQLKLLGIRLSIDDFGTGYSSFSYLLSLPLDKLKIDRMFIQEVPGDENSETIVRTILRMSLELGLEVVAEGVERQEQFEFLLAEACQYYQGYFFNKPLSAEKLSQVAIR